MLLVAELPWLTSCHVSALWPMLSSFDKFQCTQSSKSAAKFSIELNGDDIQQLINKYSDRHSILVCSSF